MSSHQSTSVERKIEHTFFLISVWSKGVAGLLETIGGMLLLLIPHTRLNALVVVLTAPELAEDPTDRVATTKLFASGYLIVHGIIKVFLVAGLLRRRLWSYPVSLWFLAGFIAYQAYRFYFTHSFWMVLLTIVDLIVAFLIWREYQARKQGFA